MCNPPEDQMLTYQKVQRLLAYNPSTGDITWKVNKVPRGKKGAIAGCTRDDGYIVVGIGGKMYLAHRLAFLLQTGKWPKEQMDHIDMNPSNNRWSNLREATHAQNLFNQKHNKKNRAKQKGIYKRKDCNRWSAMIQKDKKVIYLGLFKTKNAAAAAYKTAAHKYHGEFANY
jgi:hypothetical protein